MKNFLIGIGGTGAKCIEHLVHSCSAGLGPDKLWVGMVDQDEANGNVNKTKILLNKYINLRESLRNEGKNDLSNSLPGIVNGELSVKLKNQNELIINRFSLAQKSDLKFKIIKVTWSIENGKLYRNIYEFGDDEKSNEQLIHDFKREINFKLEKESNLLTALKREQKSPSLLSLILGPKNQEIYIILGLNLY